MSIATVVSISGQAWARDADGNMRELRVGDTLAEGESLITSDNGRVELDFADSLEPTVIEGGQVVAMTPELDADLPVDIGEFSALDEDLEALLAALDDDELDLLDVLDATAAGAGPGGGADGGHSFVQLARIAENVDPLAFEFGMGAFEEPPEIEGAGLLVAEADEAEGIEEVEEVVAPTAGEASLLLSDELLSAEGGSTASGVLPFSFGSGSGGSVSFADMDGVERQVGQETLIFSWDAGTNTLTAFSPARELNIFTLEVNPSTGAFTVTQINNLLHEEGLDEALVGLTYTVTSESGTATGTLNLTIMDDVPSLELGDVDLSEVALITYDQETADGTSIATGSVAVAFNAAVDASYGADGAGSTVISGYALTLNDIEHGLESGGEPIVFELVDGIVIGTANGSEVLRIEVDAENGEVTVTQSGPVDHPEQGADSIGLPAGLVGVSATVTVTDADGDTATDTINADLSGNVTIVDDLPEVGVAGDTLATEGGDVIDGTWSSDPGADSAGATLEVQVGDETQLLTGSESVSFITELGELTVNADGTWSFVPGTDVDHSDGNPSLEFTLIKTDGDGDVAEESHTITLEDGTGPTPGDEDGEGGSLTLALADAQTVNGSHVVDGQLAFTAGSDAITTFAFGDTAGLTVTGLDGELVWTA
ncbi:retention module-containing protein, partial [Billgrantia montanilacus]